MNHLAAIHASAKQLGQSEDDRRALMMNLVGKSSCKAMNAIELAAVRAHYDGLTKRQAKLTTFKQSFQNASPLERKVWALWNEMGRMNKLDNPTPAGLQAFVMRTVHVSHIRFCNSQQLDKMIEVLKEWGGRELTEREKAWAAQRKVTRAAHNKATG